MTERQDADGILRFGPSGENSGDYGTRLRCSNGLTWRMYKLVNYFLIAGMISAVANGC